MSCVECTHADVAADVARRPAETVTIDGAAWAIGPCTAWSPQYVTLTRDGVTIIRPLGVVRGALAHDARATS